jgi:hypothetical protein
MGEDLAHRGICTKTVIHKSPHRRPWDCPHAPIRETHSLWGLIFSARNIVPVLLKEDTFVLPSSGGRDVITIFLQPIDDFFGGLLIRLSAFRVKVGQYLVQTINPDLYTIRKSQYTPTNCWPVGIVSSVHSPYFRL